VPRNHVVLAFFVLSLLAGSIQSSAGFDAFDQPMADMSPVNLEVIGSISMSLWTRCIAVDDWANRVYVGTNESLIVINGETDTVAAEIPMDYVEAIAVNPRTSRVYVGTSTIGSGNITVLDGATNLKVGEIPHAVYDQSELAVNPITSLVYVFDSGVHVGEFDSLQVYDGENFNHTATVYIPESSTSATMERVGVAVNSNTNKIFATWTGNSNLYLIDGNNYTVTQTVHPTSFDKTVMVNPYTNYVYVGSTVLNGENLKEVTSSYEIEAIDSPHNLLFATSDYSVLCLDGSSHAVRDNLKLETYLGSSSLYQRITVNPYANKLYVFSSLDKKIYVIGTGASSLPTPSPVPTPSPSPSPSPTPSPTVTASPTPTPSHTPSPTPTSISTLSPSPSSIIHGQSMSVEVIYAAVAVIAIAVVAVAAVLLLKKRKK